MWTNNTLSLKMLSPHSDHPTLLPMRAALVKGNKPNRHIISKLLSFLACIHQTEEVSACENSEIGSCRLLFATIPLPSLGVLFSFVAFFPITFYSSVGSLSFLFLLPFICLRRCHHLVACCDSWMQMMTLTTTTMTCSFFSTI